MEATPAWMLEAGLRGQAPKVFREDAAPLREVVEKRADPFDSLSDLEKELCALYLGSNPIVLAGHAMRVPEAWRQRAREELLARRRLTPATIQRVDRRHALDAETLASRDRWVMSQARSAANRRTKCAKATLQ